MTRTRIGPHLLGRKYVPDDRDWSIEKLHAHLALGQPVPPMSLLDTTIRQALADPATRRFFVTWAGIREFWAWLKHLIDPTPPPTPPPAPVPVPVPVPPVPVPVPPAPLVDHPAWADPIVLDQGNYGTCVGNGWAGWLAADPVEDPGVNETLARAIYYEATVIDGQPDNPDTAGGGQQGSSVRSGAKAVLNRSRLSAYAFAANVAQIKEWLQNHGTVVMGTDWYNGMFNPDGDGTVHPTGGVAGGHCYLCVDYDPTTDKFEFVNSWGTAWGVNGHFRISSADVTMLLASQGEACCSEELPLVAKGGAPTHHPTPRPHGPVTDPDTNHELLLEIAKGQKRIMADLSNLQAALDQLGSDETAALADLQTGIADLQAQIAALSAGTITQAQIDALTASVQAVDSNAQAADAAAKAVITPAP